MLHLRALALIAFSFVLQTTQAAIPENELAALTAILQHADPARLHVGPKVNENICTQLDVTCDEQQSHITGLFLRNLGLKQLALEIGQFTALEYLNLSDNELHVLPVELWQLTSLRTLRLSENDLSHIPPEIGQLSSLTSLSLSSNDITRLPPEIGQLTALTELGLSNNPLIELPKEIGQITALEEINLIGSSLKDLPAELAQLTRLKRLSLDGEQLIKIPAVVFQLYLVDLSINATQISVLSPEIANLTALTRLQITGSELSGLPKEIGQLKMLTHFYLDDNKLSSLPSEIGNLDKLERLSLTQNQLKTIPAELGQLTALKRLGLMFNQIRLLPPEMGHMTSLESFTLDYNLLKALPVELGGMLSLQRLRLTGNQLTALPASIGQLTNLKTLDVSGSQLTDLPASIGQLTNLETLDVSGSQLTDLPASIGHLTNLTSLDVSENQLNTLPMEISLLANLQRVSLQKNKLRSVPSGILELTNLWDLNLSSNQLTELPEQLGQLVNLKNLELNNNLLSSLPDSLTQILGGSSLVCSGSFNGGSICSITPFFLRVEDNCLFDAALSSDLLDWLDSDAISTSSNWSEMRLQQHDICAKHAPLLAFTSERSEHSEQIDFINTESTRPVPAGTPISYALYLAGEANLANSALSTGQVTVVDNIWRIDTQGLAEGEYEVVFSTDNDLFASGIQAWNLEFVKVYEESHIADNVDLTSSFALNSSVDFPALSPALNLDHALFSEGVPLMTQLRQISDLAGLQANTERLYLNDDLSNQYNVRPFSIKKAGGEKESDYQITTDGLIEFTTDYQRIMTAAPAIANLSAFKVALSRIDLSLDTISSTGVIHAKENSTNSNAIYYSARADLVSVPAESLFTTPGLYTTANIIPNVPLYNHVYADEQGRLMQQTMYTTPFDWQAFKAELLAHGFSHIKIALDGLISGEIDGQKYRAYMAYDVHEVPRSRHNTEGLTPIEDLNGDGYQDLQIIFSAGDNRDQYVFSQNIYVIPVE